MYVCTLRNTLHTYVVKTCKVHLFAVMYIMCLFYPNTATAVTLVYTSLLYWLKVGSDSCIIGDHVKAIHILEVIVGVELLISLSCLLYYIGELCAISMYCLHTYMYVCKGDCYA